MCDRQNNDGSWEEASDLLGIAPIWVKPGDLSARLYLTANCGFWSGMLAPTNEAASRAAAYLQSHLIVAGQLPSYLQAHWLACGLWQFLGKHEQSELTLAYLQTRLVDLESSTLAWMMNTLIIAGLSSGNSLLRTAAARLAGFQAVDGHWPGEDASQDVHTTLEALRALLSTIDA